MPLTDSRGQNIPYSLLTDRANAQTLGQGIVDAVVDKLVLVYASAGVRGATVPNPTSGMVTWLSDARRLEIYDGTAWRAIGTDRTVTRTSTGATGRPGWTITGFDAWRSGGLCSVNLRVMRTGAGITSSSVGNVADEPVATIPPGWRPPGIWSTGMGDGYGDGEMTINPDGTVTLRSWSNLGTIENERTLRICTTYVVLD
ncbi:hypothetical protein [Streptomyces sp. SM12]|uniref:hypothetical protein n=1 Tax=Streptomyces sp. SM12 TaxID=1071602 RepID=UPI0011B03424|nr:hypothetical protein [Streptomyces sp. SM12]